MRGILLIMCVPLETPNVHHCRLKIPKIFVIDLSISIEYYKFIITFDS